MSYLKVAVGSAPSTCFDSARARVSLAETDFTDVGAVVLGMEDVAAGSIKDLAAKGLEIPVFVVTSEKDLLSSEVLKATTGVIELGKQSAVYYGREVETALTKYEASLYPPFFGMTQFVEWFDLKDVSASASRFDEEKLLWLNAQYIKSADLAYLESLVAPRLVAAGVQLEAGPALREVLALTRERTHDLNALALESDYFYRKREANAADVEKHLSDESRARMARFAERLEALTIWSAEAIHDLFKPFCTDEGIKMGLLGMPLRILVCGTAHTPSVDAVLALIGKQEVLKRMRE